MSRTSTWKLWPARFALAWLAIDMHHQASAQSMREAVEQAVRTNPEVLASTYRRRAADETVKQAEAGYWPRIDVSAGIGRERLNDPDARALGLSDTTVTRREALVTLSQMLFDGFAVKSEVARQRARVDATSYGVAVTSEDIALRVVGVYLEIIRRQESVDAALENLDNHRRLHDQIKRRSESGVGRRADLDQADARLALAQANLKTEQSALKDAEIAYQRVVGAPPRTLRAPAPPRLPQTESLALQTARSDHPAIKSAEADVAAARAQLGVAQAALSPRLDLEVGASHGRDIVQGRSDDVTAIVRLRYNLWRGGADQARIDEGRFQIEESREVLDRVRRQVDESLLLAFHNHASSRDRLVDLQRYVQASGATREAYATQFSIGQRTLLDLLNAENEYFNARLDYFTGRTLELASSFRVFAAMGMLLEVLDVLPPAYAAR